METHAEENYLKAIYSLSENSDDAVLTSVVANHIQSKPSSVTDMIQRLSDKKLVDYKKYKGVSLTEVGKQKALLIIRKHRLWELFLVKHLNFAWDEVHDIAEQLEHVKSPLLVAKLDAYLNFPVRDPHGDIIPDEKGKLRDGHSHFLCDLKEGQTCCVAAVKDSSQQFLNYLDNTKIGLDTELEIVKIIPYDNSISVRINGKAKLTLSEKVCKNLYVNLIDKHE
jgi:DtxR family Mn-dependent transcriptional regulator